MVDRLALVWFSVAQMARFSVRVTGTGRLLGLIFPNVAEDLRQARIELDVNRYLSGCFFSFIGYWLLLIVFFLGLQFVTGPLDFFAALVNGLAISLSLLVFMVFSPHLMAVQLAGEVNENLSLALRSVLVQVSAGNNLYTSLVNVSKSHYGAVSQEFERLTQQISSGEAEIVALEKLALNTQSEFLQKALWQIITSIRSGSSLTFALNAVIESLRNDQIVAIKNYAAELNFWLLIYLLFAAAIPTLGVTFLVVFGALGGLNIQPLSVIVIILVAFVIQAVMLGFLRSRIPRVFA